MTVAQSIEPLLGSLLRGTRGWRITFWDGSVAGSEDAPFGVLVRHRRALRRLLWEPSPLGLARGYVAGEVDVDGALIDSLDAGAALAPTVQEALRGHRRHLARSLLGATVRTGALGLRPKPPAIEARLAGHRHTRDRDAAAISHHYDLGNDFYRLLLGESMTYSCAYWEHESMELREAQYAKCALVADKLGLRPGMRVLDVGCGWGTFVIHAAREYGVHAVGITISDVQVAEARRRAEEAGVADRVEIRRQDYREITDGPYDAIASIGMAEHVGARNLPEYARRLAGLIAPAGRIVNHAIGRPRAQQQPTSAFIDRYIFPDGELVPVSQMLKFFEDAGLEIRDVEALRDHYGPTLRAWIDNLTRGWDRACALIGDDRARAWLLYLSGSALAFEHAQLGVNQLVAIKPDARGFSGMPRSRAEWLASRSMAG